MSNQLGGQSKKRGAKPLSTKLFLTAFPFSRMADYVKERQHYFTAEYRAERAEKMRLREIMGVD